MSGSSPKAGMHPRNRFRDGYDFDALIGASPELAAFVRPNAHGDASIAYGDPEAVKALNQALLRHAYGLDAWDLPPGALCPPIPGRSEHIHHLADLLSSDGVAGSGGGSVAAGLADDASAGAGEVGGAGAGAGVPRGPAVRVLDVGAGASCIYPLLGASEYGWSFVAAETDAESCAWASRIVAANAALSDRITCRQQTDPARCFEGVVEPGETFDLSLCNPPFYGSAEEAAEGNRRKRRNLSRGSSRGARPRARGERRGDAAPQPSAARNFGGQPGELWCPGGELGFVERMIAQSAHRPRLCRWFTSLVSKGAHLARLRRALESVNAVDIRTLDMAHGQKQSRILAWTFLAPPQRSSAGQVSSH
jgi:23S rRNA (adenine1618-N6)-methyltransferase